jgi:hypothetical protein
MNCLQSELGCGQFSYMILLNLDSNADAVYCTPLEKLGAVPLFYYFKFVSRQTKNVVEFTAADISSTTRYQKFVVDTLSEFANQKEGLWTYYIKPTNTNNGIEPNTDICESGLMYLNSNDAFTPTIYEDQNNTYKTYAK